MNALRMTNGDGLTRALQAFQTSSPSYLLMASLDFAREYREKWTVSNMKSVRISHEHLHQQINQLTDITAFTFDDWSRMYCVLRGISREALV